MRCWWLAHCLGACFGVAAVVGCGRSGAASDAATDAAGGSSGGASGAAGVTGVAGRGGTGNAAGTGASGTTGAGGQGGATGGVGGATGGAGRGGGSGAGGRGGGAGSAGCIVPGVGQNCASTQVCVYPTCKPSGICNPIPLDCVANCCLGSPCTVDGGGLGCAPFSSCSPTTYCANVPAGCSGTPTCGCLPADICPDGQRCSSVTTLGIVQCALS